MVFSLRNTLLLSAFLLDVFHLMVVLYQILSSVSIGKVYKNSSLFLFILHKNNARKSIPTYILFTVL